MPKSPYSLIAHKRSFGCFPVVPQDAELPLLLISPFVRSPLHCPNCDGRMLRYPFGDFCVEPDCLYQIPASNDYEASTL